jgi:predicted nucleic acid-binding protein
MTALVDTNVLVYRFDPRDSHKQEIAVALLRTGIESDSIRISHQAVVEFVRAVSRPLAGGPPLLALPDALREAEELLTLFTVLYPNEAIVRLALRGTALYGLSWFDAHMWAYAEHHGLREMLTEDFSNGQLIGSVRVRNPFVVPKSGPSDR